MPLIGQAAQDSVDATIAPPAGTATVYTPGASQQDQTLEAIIAAAQRGQKLSTQQILMLQTALAGEQTQYNQQLRERVTGALASQLPGLQQTAQNVAQRTQGALNDETALGWGADSRNQTSDAALAAAGGQANAIDAAALGALGGVNDAAYRANAGTAGALTGAAGTANAADQAALLRLTGNEQASDVLDRQALQGLLGGQRRADTTAERNIGALNAAAGNVAQIDAAGYGNDVGSQFAGLTDPRITASERYNMELARQTEESQQRAALQAELANQGARGIRSGGAEIGAILGSGQNTSRNRMLADMAAMQQANDRSMMARQNVDTMAQFNKSQSLAQSRWQNEFQKNQAQQGFQNQRDVAAATNDANNSAYQRAQDIYKATGTTAANQYGRAADVYGAQTGRNDTQFGRAGTVANFDKGVVDTAQGNTQDQTKMQLDADQAGFGRAGTVAGAQKDTTNQTYANLAGTDAQRVAAADAEYRRGLQGFDAAATTAGIATGQNPSPVYNALGDQVSHNEEQAALAALNKKDGILGGEVIPGMI